MRPRVRHISASSSGPPSAAERTAELTRWREQRLLNVCVEADLAIAIASDRAVDLHAFIELVERGCPPALAARIVAPFDHERDPC